MKHIKAKKVFEIFKDNDLLPEKILSSKNFQDYSGFDHLYFIFDDYFNENDELEIESIFGEINEKIDDYIHDQELIYYRECFEYLQNNNITDFKEAFDEGYTDVEQIATYYFQEDLRDKIIDSLDEIKNDCNRLKLFDDLKEENKSSMKLGR